LRSALCGCWLEELIPEKIERRGERKFEKKYVKELNYVPEDSVTDVSNNIPMEEDRFSKIEDEHGISRCNYRKVCRK
jgi:hypothetical protein